MTPQDALRGYLSAMGLSPDKLGSECEPVITGQSVRRVLQGLPVGAKVARALSKRVPGLDVGSLIDPPRKRA